MASSSHFAIGLLCTGLACAAPATAGAEEPPLAPERAPAEEPVTDAAVAHVLVATSQALLDAVTAGDQELFRRTLDPAGVFTDENGEVRTGAELSAEIGPLPEGYEGRLELVDPQVRVEGDTGVVSYEVAETLDLFGQRLETRFHTTDVYHRTAEGWRLLASQVTVLPSELEPVPVDPAVYEDYVGTYRLGDAVTSRVWRQGDRLYMQREGRERDELLPIGCDRFVREGAPRGERFFRRGGDGQVVELVDRRDNNDLVWVRVGQ